MVRENSINTEKVWVFLLRGKSATWEIRAIQGENKGSENNNTKVSTFVQIIGKRRKVAVNCGTMKGNMVCVFNKSVGTLEQL